jgi:predicted RND superfamily exporter protein
MKINFLNFIALPITFGVGLDYAINVYGRFHQSDHSHKGLKLAVSRSGSAVTVCSGTTIIGYGSLLLSKNGALFSFGMMAILGEIACLVAALIILPAMMSRKIY